MTSEGATGRVGVVLTGGGARGAYQAGALQAVAEVAEEVGASSPFSILAGTSAGAVNVSFLAAHADRPLTATRRLRRFWEELHAERVYRTDVFSLGKIGARWLAELSLNGLIQEKASNSLVDTSPLQALLSEQVRFERVGELLAEGVLRGVAVTAVDYCCGVSRTFFQGAAQPWERSRRRGEAATLSLPLVMASAAIPVLFPPVAHEGHSLGDGSVRNYTPLSPAIKLGAERLIVVGVRKPGSASAVCQTSGQPTIARIAGSLLNAVLLDAVDLDIERLQRINQTVRQLQDPSHSELRPIELCAIRPSRDVGRMAAEEVGSLPRTVRHLLGGLGSPEEGAELISYLLFEPSFTRRLAELGYADAMAQADELRRFLSPPASRADLEGAS
jgi:NTE family protein